MTEAEYNKKVAVSVPLSDVQLPLRHALHSLEVTNSYTFCMQQAVSSLCCDEM